MATKTESEISTRLERDPVGELEVPSNALFGIQTFRARENFQISRLRINPALIVGIAEIKKAAAIVNMELGGLDPEIGEVIVTAAQEVIDGNHDEFFDLDVFQAGAGTSYT
jgi:aspartate ammonia-lyase